MRPRSLRKSGLFLAFLGGCGLVLAMLALHTHTRSLADGASLAGNLGMVRGLGLTDLCLFTEARYTRNPSQADHHAPFQDQPTALEHFPAGALASPPGRRR